MASGEYEAFLFDKVHSKNQYGFDPIWMPDFLFDFQKDLITWSLRKGRAAIFADCGLGKTPMQLVWAENIVRKTNENVLIVTPIAVGYQTKREGEKFGIECHRSHDGKPAGKITITNYERLHLFDHSDYVAVVCDESSILKNYDGKRKAIITEFLRTRPYRLLCTATAAPNDYIELGTSAEALGELGFVDMLTRFFRNEQNTSDTKRKWAAQSGGNPKWRFKRHAEIPFWRWVASWARALRSPSDMGYDDDGFVLPKLIEKETVIKNDRPLNGMLFAMPAVGLYEERQERRATIEKRCEMVARLVDHDRPALIWCHLNEEGDTLERMIPDAVQVSGSDSEEKKEEALTGFSAGSFRALITKAKIGGFGMNWQHCSHITTFPSHSFEQYYQGVRRCWRFGQKNSVLVDVVTSEGEIGVLENLKRKAAASDAMFTKLVQYMNQSLQIDTARHYQQTEEMPAWL